MKKESEVFEETLKELGFHGYKPSQMTNSDYWMCTMEAMSKFADQFKPKWISVDDYFPEYEGAEYIVQKHNGLVTSMWFGVDRKFYWRDSDQTSQIIKWMPLPEKPEL